MLNSKKRKRVVLEDSLTKHTLHKNLEFTANEQYKLLRTNLDFTLPEGIKCPVIGVTSSIRSEGKSTTSINLAYVIAEKGNRVLLIDGDLRLPSVAKKMDLPSTPGLTDLLMEKNLDLEVFRSEQHENWYIVPSGNIPPNPSELLGSQRMQNLLDGLRECFDYIILDLPPVNLVSDALSVAKFINGMIVLAREEYSEKRELDRCFRQLKLANVNVLGCVINAVGTGGVRYGKYGKYGKYKHERYQYEADPADAAKAQK